LDDIEFEGVRLWYGTGDKNIPAVMGRRMAGRLKQAKLAEFEGEAHYTICKHMEQILKELLDIE